MKDFEISWRESWCFSSSMRVFREIKGKAPDVGLSTGNGAWNRLPQCFPTFFSMEELQK